MKFTSIETYEKYKNDKKILKEIEKSKQALEKRKEFYKREKEKYLTKQQSLIEEKMSRRLQRDENKINLSFEKKVRKIEGKKPLKKHQPKTQTSKLKKELYKKVQLLARLLEVDQYGYGKCISCGKLVHRTKADGGHYIPRQHMSTAFDLRNIHLQCKHCNGRLHGNPIEYRKRLVEEYGEKFVVELEALRYTTRSYSEQELKLLIDQTDQLIATQMLKFVKV